MFVFGYLEGRGGGRARYGEGEDVDQQHQVTMHALLWIRIH